MSLSVTSTEGLTVITVTSNPKSKCPVICQLLSTLCCTPVCFVSENVKQQMGRVLTVLGTLQILVGLLNVASGCIVNEANGYRILCQIPFWAGSVFVAAGIGCILVERFPSKCLIVFSVIVNIVSAVLAFTVIAYYSSSIAGVPFFYDCRDPTYRYWYRFGYYPTTTASSLKDAQMNELMKKCEHYKNIFQMMIRGLNIVMIVLAVLQVCATISSCVLSLKDLCKMKKEDKKNVEVPELHQPLMEEVVSSPAC